LLFVRGFDAATGKYKYDVNQRFGSSRAQQTSFRTPIVLTMSLGYDLAPTRDWQSLQQQLERGRKRAGNKMTEAQTRTMSAQMFPNPMATLMRSAETLHLNRKQADSIATLSRAYTRLLDSVWTPAAKYLAALPKDYDVSEAQMKLVKARAAAVDYLIQVVPGIRNMLTKGQRRVLPSQIASMLEPRFLEQLRSGQSAGEFYIFF
jgi:hypothetical protein